MTDAAFIEREPKRPHRREGDAWRVDELAAKWRTSERQIYDLIALGLLKAFSVSRADRKRERGTRIADEERLRFEQTQQAIETGSENGSEQ